jgi:hypothetical protein
MLSLSIDWFMFFVGILLAWVLWDIFNKLIFPIIIEHTTTELDRNPKWATSRLEKYYGFYDVDMVICESKFGILPRIRANKVNKKFELLIPNDIPVENIEEIGRCVLAAKIRTKYGLWYPEKPIEWLSIMCYLLDGGDIQMSNVSWEEKK